MDSKNLIEKVRKLKEKLRKNCRRARARKREVQIHLRRFGPHFYRIGWLNGRRILRSVHQKTMKLFIYIKQFI